MKTLLPAIALAIAMSAGLIYHARAQHWDSYGPGGYQGNYLGTPNGVSPHTGGIYPFVLPPALEPYSYYERAPRPRIDTKRALRGAANIVVYYQDCTSKHTTRAAAKTLLVAVDVFGEDAILQEAEVVAQERKDLNMSKSDWCMAMKNLVLLPGTTPSE